jgi:sulfite exporter TauE/SafE/copper chaperone CopZ
METSMEQGLQERSFHIGGMTCVNCQNRIEKKLKETAGVKAVTINYNTGEAAVTYDTAVTGFDEISAVIDKLGYQTLEGNAGNQTMRIIGTLVIILALFTLMQTFGTSSLAASFPLAKEGMSYAMLLIIGLLTGVHCIAMCGGINLSQTINRDRGLGTGDSTTSSTYSMLLPSLLYNGGRLVSYTLVGVLVGALGSVITLTGRFQGIVQILAGVFMVIMGINMLGLFPALRRLSPRMPKIFDGKTGGRGPLIVGFLNGFMPCGPLQAMQLYALSTGSPVRGGISMFLFCAGTIPLMFALGAVSSALSGIKGRAFSRRVMQAGAILVAALGLVMFSNGWNLSDFTGKTTSSKPKSASTQPNNPAPLQPDKPAPTVKPATDTTPQMPVIQNGEQIVNSTLQPRRYPAITVQQGIPVRWTINAPPSSINGCNNSIIIREYGIQYDFQPGDNVIEFTPTRAGRFRYTCWMGMIQSTITVIAKAEDSGDAQ